MVASDLDLLESFESGALDPAAFHHQDHVRLAWAHLQRYPLPVAIQRVCDGLRLLARHAGKPERYHETITWAWVLLVADRIARRGRRESFAAFAAANPDLLDSRLLWAHYRDETLASPEARQAFRMPDRRDAAGEPPPTAS
jgi:hypothetical protein